MLTFYHMLKIMGYSPPKNWLPSQLQIVERFVTFKAFQVPSDYVAGDGIVFQQKASAATCFQWWLGLDEVHQWGGI